MRRTLGFIIAVICAGFLCAYSQTEENEVVNSWDCTLTCAKTTEDNAYVITYSDEIIVSKTGSLIFENENDFGIVVYLYGDGSERVEMLAANSRIAVYELSTEVEYTVGLHAEVKEGTEIKLLVHDGAVNLTESKPLLRKPISAKEAIMIAQSDFDETSKKTITNFDNPKIVGIVGDENLFMHDPRGPKYVSQNKIIGKELYRVTFNTEQDGLLGPFVLYVDKYKGVLLGSGGRE